MKRINVVAGIIWNSDKSKILVSQRSLHLHKGGYWEFPGGKIENGESAVDALARELSEELSIKFDSCKPFQIIEFDYPEKSVSLNFFEVFDISGDVFSNEGQEWRWVNLSDLIQYTFPEANQPVVDALLKKQKIAE